MAESPSERELIEVKGKNLYFLDVVRGLKQEAERVLRAVEMVRPEIIAMSISREEIEGLRDYVREPYEVEMSRYEQLYAERLSRFGDVYLPPPCYLAGLEVAEKIGIELVGIDMDDETHTTAYCALINGRELLIHSMRLKFLRLQSFKADNPWDFAIKWDRKVNNLRGFRGLERERERYMAEELRKLSLTEKRIMAILDVERAEGVRKLIQDIR
ncbi:MAG: hypothetical protein QW505_02150 [Thermoplasmata archaeon]